MPSNLICIHWRLRGFGTRKQHDSGLLHIYVFGQAARASTASVSRIMAAEPEPLNSTCIPKPYKLVAYDPSIIGSNKALGH